MYVPVMKNRTVEVSVLQKLSELGVFGDNVIPLIELIQERTRSNVKSTFLEDLVEILKANSSMVVMLDFLKTTKLRSTSESIREYITRIIRYPDFIEHELSKVYSVSDQVIPVISYMQEDFSLEHLREEISFCQRYFPRIAYRFKPSEFYLVFGGLFDLIRGSDIVILDVGSAAYTSPVFKSIYKLISDKKREVGYTSIVINAHRPEDLTNISMLDREPIGEIDNSLKDLYNLPFMCRFDGFGDYATISAALPTTGGAISPVGIYYSQENNYFVSYKGRKKLLSEFPDYIAPSIVSSEYWTEFDVDHHCRCPGCLEIEQIVTREKSGKNQAQWKMITMLHYIYTMYEIDA